MYDTPTAKQPPRSAWTVALAGLGAFMAALDVVVVSTALPTLQARLGASLADLEWTINAYSLVFGAGPRGRRPVPPPSRRHGLRGGDARGRCGCAVSRG